MVNSRPIDWNASGLTAAPARVSLPRTLEKLKLINNSERPATRLNAIELDHSAIGLPQDVDDVALPELVEAILDCIESRGKSCGKDRRSSRRPSDSPR